MGRLAPVYFAPRSKIDGPLRADGHLVRDIAGNIIAQCFTRSMAALVANLINEDSWPKSYFVIETAAPAGAKQQSSAHHVDLLDELRQAGSRSAGDLRVVVRFECLLNLSWH